jgi:predicted MFS family arabinose efflux permease
MVQTTKGDSPPRRTIAALVAATIATVFPGFLTGALSVQVSAEFGVAEATYGWGLGGFFLAATAGSIVLGRLAQRIGPRRQITTILLISAAAQLFIAAAANSFGVMIGALVVCGFVNAGNQTAVNLALAQARLPRLGLGIALKQSGMPTASLFSGLAVPILALTVGWRWAFVAGAAFALAAMVAVRSVLPQAAPGVRAARTAPVSSRRSLLLISAGGAFLAFSAGALNAWVVASGVDSGLSEGFAGLMLSAGAACGIGLRLVAGFRLDSMRYPPMLVGGSTVLLGAVGMGLLGVGGSGVHIAATFLAFGGGWIWPVFTNFGIVRKNAAAAGAATGVTQMGVYVGVFSAPLITGQLIESAGYSVMWATVAAVTVVGAALTLSVARDF